MNVQKMFCLIIFAILFLLSSAQAKPSVRKPASVAMKVRVTAGEWLPYLGSNLDEQGLFAQIAKEAYALRGVELEVNFYPWARATEMSKSGEADGTLAFAKLQEREKYYHFTDSLYVGHYVLFHLKSKPLEWNSYEDLKDVPMASTRGFGGMGEEFLKAEAEKRIQVERFTSDMQSFQMLYSDRVHAVPSDREVGFVMLQRLYGDSAKKVFTHAAKEIRASEYHLVISKKTKHGEKLTALFNEGLKELKDSGRYDEIVKTWYYKPIYLKAMPGK